MEGEGFSMKEINERVKQLRLQHELSTTKFAKIIGVSQGSVSDWESDKKKSTPTAKALISISEKFGVSLDWLMTGKEQDGIQNNITEVAPFFNQNWQLNCQNDRDQIVLNRIKDIHHVEEQYGKVQKVNTDRGVILLTQGSGKTGMMNHLLGIAPQSQLKEEQEDKSLEQKDFIEDELEISGCVTVLDDEETELVELYRSIDESKKCEILGMLKMAIAMNLSKQTGKTDNTKKTSSSSTSEEAAASESEIA